MMVTVRSVREFSELMQLSNEKGGPLVFYANFVQRLIEEDQCSFKRVTASAAKMLLIAEGDGSSERYEGYLKHAGL